MKRILISLMIVLSFASCAKHTEAFDNDNDIVAVARCFEFEQVTRSDLRYNEIKGLDFFWAQTDQVGVFGESGSQQVNLKLKKKGEQIVKMYFSITKDYGLIKDKKYVAYCPMTNDMCLKASEVPFSYLGQCQSANSVEDGVGHLGKFDYMYSSPVTAEDNNKAVFDFQHKCSPIYIHITDVPDGVYSKVAVKASEAVFTTEGKYNLFEQDSAKAIVEPVMSDEISVTFDDGAVIEGQGEIHAWIMVSPFTLKGKTASLVLTDEGGNESEISIPSNYLGRYRSGKAYKMEVEYQAIQKTKYTLTYDANGGTIDGEDKKVETVSSPDDLCTFTVSDISPKLDNYDFLGWKNASGQTVTAGTKITLQKTNPKATLTAQWKEKEKDPDGSLPGVFSVSATKKVKFSQGNLQYQASTGTWRFAEHQYDFVGDGGKTAGNVSGSDNIQISETYSGWIDLFGWGTSGSSKNRKPTECFAPWSIQATPSYYYINGEKTGELNVKAETDWGFNAIKVFDGKSYVDGKPSNGWRTPTKSDLEYIMGLSSDGRGGLRYMQCFVTIDDKDVYGILVFPDGWTVSEWPGLSKEKYNIATSSAQAIPTVQSSDYQKLVSKGAVFLPQTRIRYGNQRLEVDGTTDYKYDSMGYWSATADGSSTTYSLYVSHKALFKIILGSFYSRDRGMAVRLVTDVTE